MDRFGPTENVSKKLVHLLRWTTFPDRTGLNFGWMDRAQYTSVYLAWKYYSCRCNNTEYTKPCLPPGREHHFTCSSEKYEGLVICKAKPIPLYLRPWIYWSSLGYRARNFLRSEVKHSTTWTSPAGVKYHLYTSYLAVKCSSIWKFTAWNGLPGLGNVLLQTISRTLILILGDH